MGSTLFNNYNIEKIHKFKITFIISVFNSELFIEKLLNSLLNQTNTNFNVILCDDGSTDSSLILLERYSKKFLSKNIGYKVITKSNGGVASAINRMLPYVETDYFISCDSDDWYDLDVVEGIYNYLMNNHEFSLGVMSVRYIDEEGYIKRTMSFNEYDCNLSLYDRFIRAIKIPCFTGIFIYNLNDFVKFNKDLSIYESRYGQNWQLLLPLVKNVELTNFNGLFYNHLSRKNSLSHNTETFEKEYNLYLGYSDILVHVLNHLGDFGRAQERTQFYSTYLCNLCFKNGQRSLFIRHFKCAKKSFRLYIKMFVIFFQIWKK